jgi:hypothetical protein
LSHSLQLADALVATTAVPCEIPLLTANAKQYWIIRELDLKPYRV